MATSVPKLAIKVTSDVMCPWCFVGKKNLEKAISLCKDDVEFEPIKWEPFFLDSRLPEDGLDTETYFNRKYGPGSREAAHKRLAAAGATCGIDFKFRDKLKPTVRAHVVLDWVKENLPEKQNDVMEAIFSEYFEKVSDITDVELLATVLSSCGLTEDHIGQVRRVLDDDAHVRGLVSLAERNSMSKRISGVPYFEISNAANPDKSFALSGAQPPEAFVHVIAKIASSRV